MHTYIFSYTCKREKGNKCSVGPETSICPRGKGQGPTSFSERGLFFSEIWTASQGLTVVQPRPQAEAGQSDRGWTVQIEEKNSPLEEKEEAETFSTRGYTCFMPYRYIFSTSQTS